MLVRVTEMVIVSGTCDGGDGEVVDSNNGFGIVVMVVRVTEMVVVTVDVVVVMVRLVMASPIMVFLWWW